MAHRVIIGAEGGDMKRIGLFLLAVVMVAGLAGCPGKDSDADPVGTWATTFNWECDGSVGNNVWHIYSNETFITSEGDTGTWSVSNNTFTLNYAMGTIYNGTISGDSMAGTAHAASGRSGCWSSIRTSRTP